MLDLRRRSRSPADSSVCSSYIYSLPHLQLYTHPCLWGLSKQEGLCGNGYTMDGTLTLPAYRQATQEQTKDSPRYGKGQGCVQEEGQIDDSSTSTGGGCIWNVRAGKMEGAGQKMVLRNGNWALCLFSFNAYSLFSQIGFLRFLSFSCMDSDGMGNMEMVA